MQLKHYIVQKVQKVIYFHRVWYSLETEIVFSPITDDIFHNKSNEIQLIFKFETFMNENYAFQKNDEKKIYYDITTLVLKVVIFDTSFHYSSEV